MTETVAERARQRALDSYRIVDTLPDAAYEDIVRLASLICEAPVSLVSLIDRDRQWFKARVGLDVAETPRNEAVCNHAIRTPDRLFEVNDLSLDARFAQLPVATGDDPLHFYAGMPLVTPAGVPIGTVCVLDRAPRSLDERQRSALASLARLTINLLEARHRELELEREMAFAAIESTPAVETTVEVEMPEQSDDFSVAIFELQDYAGVAGRIGERRLERELTALVQALDGALAGVQGHHVDRVTGSPDIVAIVRGANREALFDRLREAADRFAESHGVTVLSVVAHGDASSQSMAELYLRADESLSTLKDELAGVA